MHRRNSAGAAAAGAGPLVLAYWAVASAIEITEYQSLMVRGNPHLYYFTVALKLHMRIKWKLTHGVDYGAP
jgi:hypothetical protein